MSRSKFHDPKVRAKFIDHVRKGATIRVAAAKVGSSHGSFSRYNQEHPDFAKAVRSARAAYRAERRSPATAQRYDSERRRNHGDPRPGDVALFEHRGGGLTADVYKAGLYYPYQEPLRALGTGTDLIDIPVTDIGDLVVWLQLSENIDVANIWSRDTHYTWTTLLGSVRCEEKWPTPGK